MIPSIFRTFLFCVSILCVLVSFVNIANAGVEDLEDILNPYPSSMNDQVQLKQQFEQGPKKEQGLEDLLGPKDIFPFLPDNHRDSGTGKFNSF